jgi:nucleotide-binding universal stress UspA family protein
MKPFKKILCPIDFSPISRRALDLARNVTQQSAAELTVYHVVDMAALSLGNLVPNTEAFDLTQLRANREMAALKRTLGNGTIRFEVETGFPHRMIARKALEIGADLVVMGTHGASGFEKLFLGSTAEKVLHQIQIPLMAVPPGAKLETERDGTIRFDTLLMPVDFGKGSVATAEHALALAQQYGSRLLALHVFDPPLEAYTGPASWLNPVDLEQMFERMVAERRHKLEALIPADVRCWCEVEVQVLRGNAFEVIRRVAEQRRASIIIMGAHGHGKGALGWLGSTAHKVIRAAPCPVLAVRKKV